MRISIFVNNYFYNFSHPLIIYNYHFEGGLNLGVNRRSYIRAGGILEGYLSSIVIGNLMLGRETAKKISPISRITLDGDKTRLATMPRDKHRK